jgi:hypothetical protein
MKSKFVVPVGCLALGLAIGWVAKSAPSANTGSSASDHPTASVSTSSNSGKAMRSEIAMESGPAIRPARPKIVTAGSEAASAVEQMMNQMPDQAQMKKLRMEQEQAKFENRFTKLTAELNLSPEQQTKIRATMEESLKKMGDDEMKGLAELMKNGGLDGITATTLTKEQQASFTAVKAKDRQNRIDSKALRDLGNLTTALDLNQEQKDAAYGVLCEQAAKQEGNQGAAVTTMQTMTDDPALMDLVMERLGSPDDLKKRTDERVEAMRPILNEQQLQQYRAYLEKRSADNNVKIITTEGKPVK